VMFTTVMNEGTTPPPMVAAASCGVACWSGSTARPRVPALWRDRRDGGLNSDGARLVVSSSYGGARGEVVLFESGGCCPPLVVGHELEVACL
jgi:hypothetical protein